MADRLSAATDRAAAAGTSLDALPYRTATIGGRSVAYLAAGDGDPVVLVHGGGLDSASVSWRETVPALAPDYAVFAPDLPGYGRSDPPTGAPSVPSYAGVLARFLEPLEVGPAALVGLSLGGAVALGTALDRPDLVERLVLVDSYGLGRRVPGGRLAALSMRVPGLTAATWALLARSRWLTGQALRAVVHPANRTPALVDEVHALLGERRGDAWRAFLRAEVGFGGLRTDYRRRLRDLAAPTLFVHGVADPLVPAGWSVRGATLAPAGELCLLERCGHWPPRERPAEFNDVVRRFLG